MLTELFKKHFTSEFCDPEIVHLVLADNALRNREWSCSRTRDIPWPIRS